MTNLIALPNGTELVDDYRIERVLGAGGFGITYLADEVALARPVTIKEYFPSDFAARAASLDAAPRSQDCAGDYRWGLDRFIEEAQTLARFNHPNIVRVYRYFRANNTGYMVLHFEEGQSLKNWLKGLGRAPRQKELDAIIAPLLDALEMIHAADFLHRDIAPDNIIIRRDGAPVLIDFGSARGEMLAHSKTVSALVKPGYSPYEQYAETSKQQGPWTDIYALGATLYHAVAGRRPPDSPSRMVNDEIVPAREAALSAYRPRFLKAIDKALNLNVDGRPQSVAEWRGELLGEDAPARKGWLGGAAGGKRGEAPVPDAAGDASMPIPPPPDAPGRQGGMLDFVDDLKGRPAGGPVGAAGLGAARGAMAGNAAEADVKSRPKTGKADAPAAGPAATVKIHAPPKAFVFPRLKGKKKTEPQPEPVLEARPVDAPKPTPADADPAARSAVEKPAKAKTPPASKPAPQPAARKPSRALLPAANALEKRRKPPRPAGTRRWRNWFSILFKLMVGAGVAGVAVANQDAMRHFDIGQLFKEPSQSAPAQTSSIEPPTSKPPAAKPSSTPSASKQNPSTRPGAPETGTARNQDLPARTQAPPKVNPLVAKVASFSSAANAVAFSPDSRVAVVSGKDASLSIHDGLSGGILRTISLDHGPAISLDIEDGTIATGHADGAIGLWDLGTGAKLANLRRNEASIWSLSFTDVPGQIVAAAHDWKVSLWDINATGAPLHVFGGHENSVQALAVSSRAGMFASGGADKALRLWDLKTLDPVRTYRKHRDFISAVAFRPDGRYIASGSLDGEIRIWSVKSRRLIRRLRGHKKDVTSMAFSPDGSLLASSGADGTIRIWSMKRGRTLLTLASHPGEVAGIAFAPNGARVASVGDDGNLRLWTLEGLRER